jgi:hypothetical protein
MRSVFFGILLFFCCGFAQGQYAVYGTVGGLKSEVGTNGWTTAGTVGLYHQVRYGELVGFGYDVRGTFSSQLNSVLVGPRLALVPVAFPIKPYVEGLIGVSWYTDLSNARLTDKDFTYELVGGVDSTVLPHVDWRVAEFSFGGLSALSSTVHPKTVSTGVVFRF